MGDAGIVLNGAGLVEQPPPNIQLLPAGPGGVKDPVIGDAGIVLNGAGPGGRPPPNGPLPPIAPGGKE